MTGERRDGARLVSMYEAMLACAVRQKEAAERGDLDAFEREALNRQELAARVDGISPAILAGGAPFAKVIEQARSLALKIAEVDSESGGLIEKARSELVEAISRLGGERQCIAAYGSIVGFDVKDTAFVDRLK